MSIKILDEDIKCLIDLNSKILLEIAAETTNKLTKQQEQLLQCKWTDGESNTDTDFSELACKCAGGLYMCKTKLSITQ